MWTATARPRPLANPLAHRCRRSAALLLATLVLGGCAATPPLSTDEPAYPAATVLVLAAPVIIPARRSGAWLGKGPLVINPKREEIVCRLEVRTQQDADFTVEPDHFTVVGVARDREGFMGQASSGAFTPFYGVGAESAWIRVNTYIYLSSPRQPEVLRLKCQQARDDFALGVLTPEDLEPVLGDIITVLP